MFRFFGNFGKKLFRFELSMLAIVLMHSVYDNILNSVVILFVIYLLLIWMAVSVIGMFIAYKHLKVTPYVTSKSEFKTKADE